MERGHGGGEGGGGGAGGGWASLQYPLDLRRVSSGKRRGGIRGGEAERDLERTEATLLMIFTNLNSNISLNVSKLDGVAPLVTYPLQLGKIHQFAILHFVSR